MPPQGDLHVPFLGGALLSEHRIDNRVYLCGTHGLVVLPATARFDHRIQFEPLPISRVVSPFSSNFFEDAMHRVDEVPFSRCLSTFAIPNSALQLSTITPKALTEALNDANPLFGYGS